MSKTNRLAFMLGMLSMVNVANTNYHSSNLLSKKDKKLPPKGKLFRFEDGFECYALNQKNADKKHNKKNKI